VEEEQLRELGIQLRPGVGQESGPAGRWASHTFWRNPWCNGEVEA